MVVVGEYIEYTVCSFFLMRNMRRRKGNQDRLVASVWEPVKGSTSI